jgi:hypothetical protein
MVQEERSAWWLGWAVGDVEHLRTPFFFSAYSNIVLTDFQE